jgi:hypothetical protein
VGDDFLEAISIPAGPLTETERRAIVERGVRVNTTAAWVQAHPAALAHLVQDNLKYKRSRRGISTPAPRQA